MEITKRDYNELVGSNVNGKLLEAIRSFEKRDTNFAIAITALIESIKQLKADDGSVLSALQKEVRSHEQTSKDVNKVLVALKEVLNAKEVWEFNVYRDERGYIEKVIAKEVNKNHG